MTKPRKRDSDKTQANILDAAFQEFVQHGRAGARVDRIAEIAQCNKAMIYHYFRSKDGLFDALITQQSTMTADVSDTNFDSTSEAIKAIQQLVTTDWVRFSMWEALEMNSGHIAAESERRKIWKSLVNQVQEFIDAGVLPKRFDAAHLELAGTLLFMSPVAFPQLTKLITGKSPNTRKFQQEWREFLMELTGALAQIDHQPN